MDAKRGSTNVFMERDSKSGIECTFELIHKLVVAACKEAFDSDDGSVIVDAPWADPLIRSDPFGLVGLGATLCSKGMFIGYGRTKVDVSYGKFLPPVVNPMVIAEYLNIGGNVGYYFKESLEAVALGVDRKCTVAKLNIDPTTEAHQMICEALRIFQSAKEIHDSYSGQADLESGYMKRRVWFGEYLAKNIDRLDSIKRGETPCKYKSTLPVAKGTISDGTSGGESSDSEINQKEASKQKGKKRPAAYDHEEDAEDTASTALNDAKHTTVKLNKTERTIIDETASSSQDCAYDFLAWARNPFSVEVTDNTRRLYLLFAARLSLVDKIRVNNKHLLELVKERPDIFDQLSRKIERTNIGVGIVSDQSSTSDENVQEDRVKRKRKKKKSTQKQANGERACIKGEKTAQKQSGVSSVSLDTNGERISIKDERTAKEPSDVSSVSLETLLGDELCELLSTISLFSFKKGTFSEF